MSPREPQGVVLEDKDIRQLVKMLRLLGSESVGERAAAALKVSQWVASRDLDWADLIMPEAALPQVQVGVADERPGYRPNTFHQHAMSAAAAAQQQMAAQAQAAAMQNAMNAQAAQYNPYVSQGLGSGLGAAAAQSNAQPFQASPPPSAPKSQEGRLGGSVADWRTAAQAMVDWHPGVLRGQKEQQFVADRLAGKWDTLTDRQEKWLRDICARANITWGP